MPKNVFPKVCNGKGRQGPYRIVRLRRQRAGDSMMQLAGQIWLQRGVLSLQLQRRLHRQLWQGCVSSGSSSSSSSMRKGGWLLGGGQGHQLRKGSPLLSDKAWLVGNL